MRALLLTLVAVMVMGCSTAGGSTERPTAPPEPSRTVEAPVSVTGDPDTGASGSFALAGGSYEVAWTTTADTAGCYFSLFLATKIDGPSVMNDVKLLPEAKSYSNTFLWLFVEAGTYVLQEDRSGFGHCIGPWSATITPRWRSLRGARPLAAKHGGQRCPRTSRASYSARRRSAWGTLLAFRKWRARRDSGAWGASSFGGSVESQRGGHRASTPGAPSLCAGSRARHRTSRSTRGGMSPVRS
jgi:hypothetical protein